MSLCEFHCYVTFEGNFDGIFVFWCISCIYLPVAKWFSGDFLS